MKRDLAALVRLNAARLTMPFDWRTNCCVGYACEAVRVQTGRDIRAELPAWSSEDEARAILAQIGGLEAATDRLLRPLRATADAHRGDIGLVALSGAAGALVVIDADGLRGPGPRGLRLLPRAFLQKAWSAVQ